MPSYTYSTGQVASGSELDINTGTVTTPVWTPIGQITDIAQSGKSVKTIPATNLQSLVAEVLPTLPDSGHLKCSAIRVPNDAGQAAVLTQFNLGANQAPVQFRIQLNKDAAAGQSVKGDAVTFFGYVIECEDFASVAPEKIVMYEFTIKVQSLYTFVAGS